MSDTRTAKDFDGADEMMKAVAFEMDVESLDEADRDLVLSIAKDRPGTTVEEVALAVMASEDKTGGSPIPDLVDPAVAALAVDSASDREAERVLGILRRRIARHGNAARKLSGEQERVTTAIIAELEEVCRQVIGCSPEEWEAYKRTAPKAGSAPLPPEPEASAV